MPFQDYSKRIAIALTCTILLTTACKASESPETSATEPAVTAPSGANENNESTITVTPELIESSESVGSTFLSPGDFAINGMSIGMTQAEVIEQLGEPDDIGMDRRPGDTLLYSDGMKVYLGDDFVTGAVATGTDFCTPSGICPGDSLESIFNRLGTTVIAPDDGSGRYAAYRPAAEDNVVFCWLEIHIDENHPSGVDTAKDVALACQP
ncbi:MAG: hypothetical protein AAGN15_00580 [Cyanobacteria bacterium J06581_3]